VSGTPTPPEVRIGDLSFVVETLARDVEAEARHALERRARFTIAIPGGSVATTCFPRLARLDLDWSSIEIFWTDERAVAPSGPDSNHAVAQALWLGPAGVPIERIHRMPGEAADLERAARSYALELESVAGTPPRLDYALLGVGPDGHVASLFPGHPALLDQRPVLAIEDAPKPPPRRLTLSLPVLAGAGRVTVVALGKEKAHMTREALEGIVSPLPVARLAREARSCLFLLDREAGSRVERGA
jgi:6-phosphogluconolactonase